MKSDFKLVGLSKPRSATLEFLHTDAETFWAKIDMPDDRIEALWGYVSGNWKEKKIAEVECDGLYKDGTPINPRVVGIREWNEKQINTTT